MSFIEGHVFSHPLSSSSRALRREEEKGKTEGRATEEKRERREREKEERERESASHLDVLVGRLITMVKLGGEARGDENPQGSAPPQQQQEKDSGGGGEDKSGVGRSSSVTRIMENARIKVACLGVVYHCNKASLKPVDLSRRNNAPFPTSSSSKSSSSALSMNISQLKLQFFQSKERAEEQAKREWKIRRSLRNHRQRLLKIVNGFQNLEQRLVGGMALPRVKPYRVVNRPAVFSLSLSNAFRLCTKYPGSFEIACDEKEQKEVRPSDRVG